MNTLIRTAVSLLFISLSFSISAASITVAFGDATSVTTKQEIGTIFIASPDIADYQILDANKFIVFGRGRGDTRIMVFDKENNKIYDRKVNVVRDVSLVNRQLKMHYPDLNVSVESIDEQVLVRGEIINQTQHQEVIKLIGELLKLEEDVIVGNDISSGDDDDGEVKAYFNKRVEYKGLVDKLKIATADQINVKLSIAEVSRQLNEELGFKWSDMLGDQGKFLFKDFKFGELQTILTAINDESVGQMLAEPNLSVISGESASFLVGGELPVVTTSNNGTTVAYKSYGIKLAFAAKTLESGRIRLKLSPEVSSLDKAYQINGDSFPALRTRKAETTIEIKDGESFVLAGLLSSDDVEGISKLPGAGDIPIIGSLFRNTTTERTKRELIIVATVNRVKAQHQSDIQMPHMQRTSTLNRLLGLTSKPKHGVTYELLSNGGFEK
ncbi:type II and III secretion system protein family protein [Photobacterium sanguinicancri]|uniref:type II and III secretion system protein family protein n=1 Tax=Photobacterium sanguinicancri TaxID=875932 RepID=UPI002480C9EF|nr:pilus assembly protein N-terminal domain-containing protein [Photobacterium sanguinicancri]